MFKICSGNNTKYQIGCNVCHVVYDDKNVKSLEEFVEVCKKNGWIIDKANHYCCEDCKNDNPPYDNFI